MRQPKMNLRKTREWHAGVPEKEKRRNMAQTVLLLYMPLPLSSDADLTVALASALPEEVVTSSNDFRSSRRKLEFLAGRFLLKNGLARMNVERELGELELTDIGRPFFHGGPFFSISHTPGMAACALSRDVEVGLDVESHRPLKVENFRPWFSSEELDEIQSGENPEWETLRRWTVKEALFKAAGSEEALLFGSAACFECPLHLAGGEWQLILPDVGEGLAAAMVVGTVSPEITMECVSFPGSQPSSD